MKRKLDRRDFIRSMGLGAGASVLGSIACRLVSDAHAATPAPVRFVVFHDQQGWDPYRYEPSGTDLKAGTLNPAMAPLEPYKERMLLLDRFYNPFNIGLHGNGSATWAMRGTPLVNPEGVDSGERHPDKPTPTFFDVVAPVLQKDAIYDIQSADVGTNPHELYQQLFGDIGNQEDDTLKKQLTMKRRRLDFLKDDVARLQSRLAGEERAKLELYLSTIDSMDLTLERRLNAAIPTCTPPTAPDPSLPPDHQKYKDIDPARVDALFETLFSALICGMTNVARFEAIHGRGNFGFLNNPLDKHNTQHESFKEGDTGTSHKQHLVNIDLWYTGYMAELMKRLAAIPEGDGTMLDNTLIIWLNGGGGKHHTSATAAPGKRAGTDNYPVVLFGNPVGLFKGGLGRYVKYPQMDHSMGDVFATVAHALGVPLDSFGDPEHFKGVLPGIT